MDCIFIGLMVNVRFVLLVLVVGGFVIGIIEFVVMSLLL